MAANRCSFCDRHRSEVDQLVGGPGEISICPECVLVASEVLASVKIGPSSDRVLTGISNLVTNDPRQGGLLGVVEDAAIAIRFGKVTWVGSETKLPGRYRDLPEIQCGGRIALPGFVDSYTRLIGTKPSSQDQTPEELSRILMDRITTRLSFGSTTLAITVGGQNQLTADTAGMVAVQDAAQRIPGNVQLMWQSQNSSNQTAPNLDHLSSTNQSSVRLTTSDDASQDGNYPESSSSRFPTSNGRLDPQLLQVASHLADYWVVPGSSYPEFGQNGWLQSAPKVVVQEPHPAHLAGLSLAKETMFVGLNTPTANDSSFLSQRSYKAVLTPPAILEQSACRGRELWDAGVTVGLASGADPDQIEVAGMGLVIALAVAGCGLDTAEAIWAATRGSAEALGLSDVGWLGLGSRGDLVVLDSDRLTHLVSHPDSDLIHRVVIGGDILPVKF